MNMHEMTSIDIFMLAITIIIIIAVSVLLLSMAIHSHRALKEDNERMRKMGIRKG